ncbi:MAG: SYNERG-CTERM sorting domain-containing protein, partial [Synergistaceae bacterium]|nr:SYNERG-CTERM sorting domain-containing protein [Synergistaceae bacterium]
LNVTEEMSYTNVHEGVWNQLGIYDNTLTSLTFADADPALVDAAAFQSDFRKVWNVAATQVTEIKEEDSSFTAPTRDDSLRPGIGASFANRLPGDLIPLKYQWTYTWDELSSMLGRTVSNMSDLSNLSALKIDFEVNGGSVLPVVGTASANAAKASVKGINAGDAQSSGSLVPEEASGGASFNLTAYVANVASTGENDGPQFVQNLLVVPDGTADGTLAGTMWTTATGGSGEGGGGGGGCDASGLGLLALLVVVPAFMRKR